MKKSISPLFSGLAVVFFLLLILACKTNSLSYRNTTVPELNQILLESGGRHEHTWQTEDLAVNYKYVVNGKRLKFSALIVFSDNIKNYDTLHEFDLWLNFIASDNTITSQKSISPHAYYYEITDISVELKIELPPDTKAIVFSYSGVALTTGSNRPPHWEFWQTPG